jgi:type II secretory pathway pseudopilin PulG
MRSTHRPPSPIPTLLPARKERAEAFTILELALVILVVSALFFVGLRSSSTPQFWQRQAALRELNETMRFLFHQAVADQTYYQIEFDMSSSTYTVGAIIPEPETDERLADFAGDAGNISLELNAFLNPSYGETHTVIPPPEFPSLGTPRQLPNGIRIEAIYTPKGWTRREEEKKVRMRFSPKGFAEFIALHILIGDKQEMTLVNNPFTGLTQTFNEWKDYEWTFAEKKT